MSIYFKDHSIEADHGRRSLRAGAAIVGARVLVVVIQLVTILVLARLLSPEDYGLVGMVTAITVFAPGRGGHANDFENRICAPHALLSAATAFGKQARVTVTWLVAANDTYFSPEFSRKLVEAFRAGGGKAELHVLPAFGSEGHWLPETESGVKLAASDLDRALKVPVTVKKR